MNSRDTRPRPSVRTAGAVLMAMCGLALAACAPGDDPAEPVAAGTPASAAETATSEPATEPAQTAEEAPEVEPAGEPGTAVLRVDGVEYSGFTGDCAINRNFGREDVGSLDTPGLTVSVALDNSDVQPEAPMIYVALAEDTFSLRDALNRPGAPSADNRGSLDSITEVGARTADGSREIALVRFTGELSEGTAVEADVVCTLQNTY